MSEYVTGQNYGWNGGECPVHPETKVELWFRGGDYVDGLEAGNWRWTHNGIKFDIVCFKVVTPYVEPKTIWVNEYESGCGATYTSEKQAKSLAYRYHTRVAVKYVEVKE